jgi:hypothetical protein
MAGSPAGESPGLVPRIWGSADAERITLPLPIRPSGGPERDPGPAGSTLGRGEGTGGPDAGPGAVPGPRIPVADLAPAAGAGRPGSAPVMPGLGEPPAAGAAPPASPAPIPPWPVPPSGAAGTPWLAPANRPAPVSGLGPVGGPGPVTAPATRPGTAPGPGPGERPGTQRLWYPAALVAAAVILLLSIPAVLLIANAQPGSAPGPGPGTVSVSRTVTGPVYLHAPPGVLVVTAAPAGPVVLTGQLHWPSGTAAAHVTATRSGGALRLSYRCPAGQRCTASLRLRVPPRTPLVLDQSSGHLVLDGLTGPVSLTGMNVSVLGTGLRSATFAAAITSGQLTAGFTAPPSRLQLTLASAQATLRLPATVRYAVIAQAGDGSVSIGVPRSAGSAHRIYAQLGSAELRLAPA